MNNPAIINWLLE